MSTSLTALSAAAVLSVYAAGYARTRSAAERLQSAEARRRPLPVSAPASPPAAGHLEDAPRAAPAKMVSSGASSGGGGARPHPRVDPPSPSNERGGHPADPIRSSSPLIPATGPAAAAARNPAPSTVPAESRPSSEAVPPPAPVSAPPAERLGPYKDGTYLGWGSSRHGDIQASVVIESGRIASTAIAQCLTRYTCEVIAHLPKQVVKRQTPDVDVVGGATQSSDAFYWAVFDALSRAK
jgi:uncharacterized protein with FMN-binding domain